MEETLSKKFSWYRFWHQQPVHQIIHWFVVLAAFGAVVLLATGQIFQAVENQPNGQSVSSGKVNTNTNYVLLKTDDQKLKGDLEKKEGLTKDAVAAAILDKIGVTRYKISANDTADEVTGRLKAALHAAHPERKPDVQFAEIDSLAGPSFTPNDPYYPYEWHMSKISAPLAWDSATGKGVTIAIIDTGVDCAHPDLGPHCVPGWNVSSNNVDTTDIFGHGTAVAGQAGAIGNNGIGVVGVAWEAKLMPIRISDDSQSGFASYSTAAAGITYAADHGAKVANLSYGMSASSTVQAAAQYLQNKGGLLTVAAGNSATDIGTAAATPALITVSATDQNDVLATWSNYGAGIDISAPGVSGYTTCKNNAYCSGSGTSFSAPVVAGVLALEWAANSDLTPAQAESVVESTAHDLGTSGWDQYYGWGRVDSGAAIAKALGLVSAADTTAPSVPTNLAATATNSSTISLTWTASTDAVGVAGYQIFRNGVQVGTNNTTTYIDSGLAASTSYSYSVKAYDASNNNSDLSPAVSVTTPAVTLSFLTGPIISGKTSVSLTQNNTTSLATTQVVRYGTSRISLNQFIADPTSATSHTITIPNLKAKTTYYYQVEATSATGSKITSAVFSARTAAK